MDAQIASLEQELEQANQQHESRLASKTETLRENVVYYGSKCQQLLEAIVDKRKFDPMTGARTSVKGVVEQLRIDPEKVKFNMESEEFTCF